jgi:DNA-binding SARP family transcriptional activator/tetratricopeptide (TPR) repeat protein
MEFRVLGPLEVVDDGRALLLRGWKQRALLALLVLEVNRPISRDRLIDVLWEDEPTATAPKALHVYVSQLRKLLGHDRVQTRPEGYLLRADPGEVDLTRFQHLVGEGKPRDALKLWRGAPLAEFADRAFAQADIARLEELYLACLEARLGADLDDGRDAEVVGEIEALVQAHPLRERMRELLLLALYRTGRQADALAAYQDARSALVDGLGIEPGKALRELQRAILRQDPVLDLAMPFEELDRGAFVGRNAELEQLIAGLDDAIAGRGRLFLLVGEPGIGKSRLADELIQVARVRRVDVLVGRCWEAGGAPAYWPWVQSLRGIGGDRLLESEREDDDGARVRLFDGIAEFLRETSRERPLVLFLDDMHAADEPSLLLLRFLARMIGEARILVVGACRDVDPVPGRPLADALAELAREPLVQRLSLRGLTETDVAAYVASTAAEFASPELVSALYEETEGNPLFVGETVRLLAVEGRIALPQSVRDVIARRLSHLSDECNHILALASVLGREFALDALVQMSGRNEDDLLDTLDEATAARIVTDMPAGPGRLRFAHVLIRDTLYEGLTTPRRVRLHRLAVDVLERLYGGEAGPHLAELAYHAIAGSEFEKALTCAQHAADRAVTLLAYEEAARLYGTAIEALELARPIDERTQCELLLSLGEAESRAGNTPAAKVAFLSGARIARRLGLVRELAQAAMGYSGRVIWGRAGADDRLVPLLEEGLAALGEKDVELRVRLLARLAGALRDEPSRERRDRLSRESLELARSSGKPECLAYALDGRAYAILGPDTVAECLALGSELCEAAESRGNREQLMVGHGIRILSQLMVGNVAGAKVDFAAAGQVAEGLGQPVLLWDSCGSQAMLALAEGRLTDGEQLSTRALAIGESALPDGAIPVYWAQQYTLADFRGALEAIERPIFELVTAYPARPVFRCVHAHVVARLGRLPEARRLLDDLTPGNVTALPFDQEWLYGMSLLAETSALVGDPDAAATLLPLLEPWAAFNAVDPGEGFRGSVSRYLGQLAATLERWDEAERHFENALEQNEQMGARPWLAYTREDLAKSLRRRNAPGDEERAAELAGLALQAYAELGMAPTRAAPCE